LLVDGDRQCNCTSFFQDYFGDDSAEDDDSDDSRKKHKLDPALEAAKEAAKVKLDDMLKKRKDGAAGVPVLLGDEYDRGLDAILPRQFELERWLRVKDHNGIEKDVDNIYTIIQSAHGAHSVIMEQAADVILIQDLDGKPHLENRLMLLPGSPALNLIEQSLELNQTASSAVTYYGVFRKVLLDTAKKWKADVVIVDLGPSGGKWNQAMAMSSDYILPTVLADYFSTASVHGLIGTRGQTNETKVLPKWIEWVGQHRTLISKLPPIEVTKHKNNSIYHFDKTPKLLPFLVQGYEMDSSGGTRMKESEACFLESIRIMVEEQTELDKEILESYICDGEGKMVVPFLRKLEHNSVAQNVGVSLMQISKEHLDQYWKDEPDIARKIFASSTFEIEKDLVKNRFQQLAKFVLQIFERQASFPHFLTELLSFCSRRRSEDSHCENE
jgi:cellulose biosynthesis protein BcsQ